MTKKLSIRSDGVQLDFTGVILTENSLTITDQDSFDKVGVALARFDSSGSWYWADYLIYAEDNSLKTVLDSARADLHRSTILSYKDTGRFFAPKDRHPKLSFSHHSAVMYVLGTGATVDAAKKWLKIAYDDRMTVGELREAIRNSKRSGENDPGPIKGAIRITDFVKLSKWSSKVDVQDIPTEDVEQIRHSTESLFKFLCSIHQSAFNLKP